MTLRQMNEREALLLRRLVDIGSLGNVADTLLSSPLLVRTLSDGGMGSFQIITSHRDETTKCGRIVASAKSTDADGTLLVATLIVSEDGTPCEIDIWKVDFSSLIEIPEKWEPEDFPRLPGSGTGNKQR
ncbi:DUF6984 family protein [Cupriavidus sp. TMH.W2]|uniref:DUF6984 family protein n=1 Tax=Cupriavidus sp. TMH.W2 TaxID=3434465 RepID=UPI003D78A751